MYKQTDNNPDYFYGPYPRTRRLTIWFAFAGTLVTILWLILFMAGLLVDSSLYRAAIGYNIADLKDWFSGFVTFTFTNVILLAFMSGLLGGITSKLRSTREFTITIAEMAEMIKSNKIQMENPFISAFRGIIVFVAILSLQYVSSFNDLGSISNTADQAKTTTEIKYGNLFTKFSGYISDTSALRKLREEIKKEIALSSPEKSDSATVSTIFSLKTDLHYLKLADTIKGKRNKQIDEVENKINTLKRGLKLPSNADFAGIGISSFSYFKFAVIVSFLAFIFGYDSSRFAEFMGKILSGKNGGSGNPPGGGAG